MVRRGGSWMLSPLDRRAQCVHYRRRAPAKVVEVSSRFPAIPMPAKLQMIRATHLHLHEHERPPFASQQPTIYFPTKIRLTTLSKATFYSSYIILFSFVRKERQDDMYVIHIVYESLHFWACALEVITLKTSPQANRHKPSLL